MTQKLHMRLRKHNPRVQSQGPLQQPRTIKQKKSLNKPNKTEKIFSLIDCANSKKSNYKLQKQMIPHFVALDVGFKIYQVQLCRSIRRCHRTFLLKSTLFKGEVAWQPLVEQQDCSPSTLESRIRAFK